MVNVNNGFKGYMTVYKCVYVDWSIVIQLISLLFEVSVSYRSLRLMNKHHSISSTLTTATRLSLFELFKTNSTWPIAMSTRLFDRNVELDREWWRCGFCYTCCQTMLIIGSSKKSASNSSQHNDSLWRPLAVVNPWVP